MLYHRVQHATCGKHYCASSHVKYTVRGELYRAFLPRVADLHGSNAYLSDTVTAVVFRSKYIVPSASWLFAVVNCKETSRTKLNTASDPGLQVTQQDERSKYPRPCAETPAARCGSTGRFLNLSWNQTETLLLFRGV